MPRRRFDADFFGEFWIHEIDGVAFVAEVGDIVAKFGAVAGVDGDPFPPREMLT